MYVIDLFKELNANDIVNTMVSFPGFFELIDWNNKISEPEKQLQKEKIKEKYLEEVKNIQKKTNIVYSNNVIIITKRINDDEIYYDAASLDLTEKEKIMKSVIIDEEKGFVNPLYDISFVNRNEIFGMLLSDVNLNRYTKLITAAAILDDITSFGINEDVCSNKQNEIKDSLVESVNNIKNGTEKTYTIEELFERLDYKDDRTEEEKALAREKIHQETLAYINGIVEEIKLVIKEQNWN